MESRVIVQAGVVPIYRGEICLVTSSRTRQWIVPKGQIDKGMTAIEAAKVEAWEEAGVKGKVLEDVVGTYEYQKWERQIVVELYLQDVSSVAEKWPEMKMRERRLVSIEDAMNLISHKGISAVVRQAHDIWITTQM